MNLKEIREMITLMNDNDLTEIEVEREGTKIKIRKSGPGTGETVYRPPVPVFVEPKAPGASAEGTADSSKSRNQEIQSPMVGTFYRSPSPESPSFVEVGQIVEVGQVVCIVEAMKLMNEIKSEIRGKIVEAPVENAQPVEFGQALFYLEPV
jgi:oxaloacetate decarboxylase alpha subunit